MTKIYLHAIPTGGSSYGVIRDAEITGDVVGHALSEDGVHLASHFCSGVNWAKHDMGLTSEWKHDIYRETYPDGFELEWVDYEDLDTHVGYNEAYRKYQAMKE